MSVPQLTHHTASFPSGHHAFMTANVLVRDSGRGALVDLEFEDGTLMRSRVTTDLARLGPGLAGRWRASIHFRTEAPGRPHEPVFVRRLRPVTPDLEQAPPVWSAAGKVVRLDRTDGLVLLRIFPEQAPTEPFVVSAFASLELLSTVEGAGFVSMHGGVRGSRLIVRHIEAADLTIPERWKDWTPKAQRQTRASRAARKEDEP